MMATLLPERTVRQILRASLCRGSVSINDETITELSMVSRLTRFSPFAVVFPQLQERDPTLRSLFC